MTNGAVWEVGRCVAQVESMEPPALTRQRAGVYDEVLRGFDREGTTAAREIFHVVLRHFELPTPDSIDECAHALDARRGGALGTELVHALARLLG